MKRLYTLKPEYEPKPVMKRLQELDGVSGVRINKSRRLLSLRFDPCEIDEEEILAAARVPLEPVQQKPARRRILRLCGVWITALIIVFLGAFAGTLFTNALSVALAQMLLIFPLLYVCAGGIKSPWRLYTLPMAACAAALGLSVINLFRTANSASSGSITDYGLFFGFAAFTLASVLLVQAFDSLSKNRVSERYNGVSGIKCDATALTLDVRLLRKSKIICAVLTVATCVIAVAAGILGKNAALSLCLLAGACPTFAARLAPRGLINGISVTEKNGFEVPNAASLERVASADTLVMPAEGFVLFGKASVTDNKPDDCYSYKQLLALAASALSSSESAVAKAIVAEAEGQNIPLDPINSIETEAGRGVRALIGETRVAVGTREFMLKNAFDMEPWDEDAASHEGLIGIYAATAGAVKGVIYLKIEADEASARVLDTFKALGIKVHLLAKEGSPVPTEGCGVISPENALVSLRLMRADKRRLLCVYNIGNRPECFDEANERMCLGGDDGENLIWTRKAQTEAVIDAIRYAKAGVSSAKTVMRLNAIYTCLVWAVFGVLPFVFKGIANPLYASCVALLISLLALRLISKPAKLKRLKKAKKGDKTHA